MPKAARVVPRLAVGALALAIGVVLLWPWVEEETRAIARLSRAGLSWKAEESRLRGSTDLGTLDGLGASLRTLQPKLFHLDNCHALENVDGLKGLTALESLSLWGGRALQNVDGLKGLTALESVTLWGCHALQNVDGLKGLTALESLDFSLCVALQNVDGLKGLSALATLDLTGCVALQNVDGLKGLTTLESLNLRYCVALQNVDGLKGLTALARLDLSDCTRIPRAALRELEVALPYTTITLPDGRVRRGADK